VGIYDEDDGDRLLMATNKPFNVAGYRADRKPVAAQSKPPVTESCPVCGTRLVRSGLAGLVCARHGIINGPQR
jgi:hypothetical protein